MKRSKYPRLRSHTRKGKSGQVWTWYTYDMRPEGGTEISLGNDWNSAVEKWHKLHNHIPMTKGLVQEAIERWRETCLPEYKEKTRGDYARQLARIEAVFGQAAWHEITLPALCEYLAKRTAKTQGNRELAVLSIIWNRAKLWGMTSLPWPPGTVKNWKNPEKARAFEVTDDLFAAVYSKADRVLRDAMDIATATGMRLTDVRTVAMPVDGKLRFRAGKTSKAAYFVVAESPVLSALVKRREEMGAPSTTLLVTERGLPVSARRLRERYDEARALAAEAFPQLAEQIGAMYLRDMRKRASQLAGGLEEAAILLQHSSTAITGKHYVTGGVKLKAVR